jgi:glycosyltransferase involved in cell wall biosynthesis
MTAMPWHIVVVIPARNEEFLLPRCLRSVQAARLRLPDTVTSDIVVASDCSHDRTREVAATCLGNSGVVICTESGRVGAARAVAARTALNRYTGSLNRCWIANTDADCEVPSNWLLNQLAIAKRGFTAVAGVIDVDSFDEHDASVQQLFRLTYLIHSDGTHPHVHGANMGTRADAYLLAGGWMNLATAEDHDLWARLKGCGSRQLSDATLQVITSGRRSGRAPMGFAAALAAHNGSQS